MKNKSFFLLAGALVSIAIPAYAHHAFAAEFDGSKPVRLVGRITSVQWTNPHSYFYVDITDGKGTCYQLGL